MKIVITASGGQPVTLGDDEAGDVISGDLPGQSRSVQSEPMFRANYQKVFARGNRINRRSFVTEREHADKNAAVVFKDTHADLVPDQGILEVITSDGGTTRYFTAVVESVDCVYWNGRTTQFRYSLVYTAPKTSAT